MKEGSKEIGIEEIEKLNDELRKILHQAFQVSSNERQGLMEKAKDLKRLINQGIRDIKKRHDPFELDLRRDLAKEFGYNYIGMFNQDGVTVAKKEGKCFFINPEGEILFKKQGYLYAKNFDENGLAKIREKDDIFFLINKHGQQQSDNYYSILGPRENIYVGYNHSNKENRAFFLNNNGLRVSGSYLSAGLFYDGISLVRNNRLPPIPIGLNEYFFINKKFQPINKEKYSYGQAFSEGLAIVRKNFLTTFINTKGNVVLPRKKFLFFRGGYYGAEAFSNGFSLIIDNKDRWKSYKFINKKGENIFNQEFVSALSFKEGFAAVAELSNSWNFIDTKGNLLLEKNVNYVHDFSENLAWITINNLRCLIDNSGKIILDQKDEGTADPFHEGVSLICFEHNHKYIDKNGRTIFE